jgi:hypothetical protein
MQRRLTEIEFAQAGKIADHAFPQRKEKLGVEGFVVKTHGQKTRQQAHESVTVIVNTTCRVDDMQIHARHQRFDIATDIHGMVSLQHDIDVMVC